jgi:hypothetical protein
MKVRCTEITVFLYLTPRSSVNTYKYFENTSSEHGGCVFLRNDVKVCNIVKTLMLNRNIWITMYQLYTPDYRTPLVAVFSLNVPSNRALTCKKTDFYTFLGVKKSLHLGFHLKIVYRQKTVDSETWRIRYLLASYTNIIKARLLVCARIFITQRHVAL